MISMQKRGLEENYFFLVTEKEGNKDIEMPNADIKKEVCEDDNKEMTTLDEAFRKYCQDIDGIPHCSDCNVGFKDISEIIDHMKSHITTKDDTAPSSPDQEDDSSYATIENNDAIKIKTEREDIDSKQLFSNEEKRRLTVVDILEKLQIEDSLDNKSWNRLFDQKHLKSFGIYKCFLCLKKLKTLMSIKSHIKLMHCKARFKCGVCNEKFRYKYLLIAHTEEKHPQLLFKCSLCPQERGLSTRLYLDQEFLDRHKV